LRRGGDRCPLRKDHIGLQRDQLFGKHRKPICLPGCKAIVDADIAVRQPSALLQSLPESSDPRLRIRVVGETDQHADAWHLRRLLCACRERPKQRRRCRRRAATDERDELAPFQLIEFHSIAPAEPIEDIEPAGNNQQVVGATVRPGGG
jgi:hypothetical protein